MSKKKIWLVFTIVLICVMAGSYLLGTFQNQQGNESSSFSSSVDTSSEKNMTTNPSSSSSQTLQKSQQMVYRAEIQLQIANLDNGKKKLEEIAKKFASSLISSSETEESDEKQVRITYHVPQHHFQAFLDHIKKISENPASVQITGEDVGEELVDLQARIKAKKAMETRLIAMMNKANTTGDLLDIETTLGNVQEQIEQLTGRLQYLKYHVAYSTVSVELNSTAFQPLQTQYSFFQEVAAGFLDSCSDMWIGLQLLVIYLAKASPYLVIIGFIWFLVSFIRKKRKS